MTSGVYLEGGGQTAPPPTQQTLGLIADCL